MDYSSHRKLVIKKITRGVAIIGVWCFAMAVLWRNDEILGSISLNLFTDAIVVIFTLQLAEYLISEFDQKQEEAAQQAQRKTAQAHAVLQLLSRA